MNKEDLRLVCTCNACPEQYDVMFNDKRVGYIRYRWGYLACYSCNENENIDWDSVVYDWQSSDEWGGILDDGEKCHLDEAIEALKKYYNKHGIYK